MSLSSKARERGNVLFRSGDNRAAADAYTESLHHAVAADPPDASDAAKILANRSACYLLLSMDSHALEDASLAVELAPGYAKGHHRVAKALDASGKRKAALQAKRRARELDEDATPTKTAGSSVSEAVDPDLEQVARLLQKVNLAVPVDTESTVMTVSPTKQPVSEPLDPEERVRVILSQLRPTLAGSKERQQLVLELHTILQNLPQEKPRVQVATSLAFVDAEGPEIMYDMESSMRGDWLTDAKNGTMRNISNIRSLEGHIGTACATYRSMLEDRRAAIAKGACDHESH